ncbi:MAG: phosphatase PAP2 family protein [Halovenus sp.]
MSRAIGEVELLQELLPAWAVAIAGLLTQLGDAWFLLVLIVALFVRGETNRQDIVALLGVSAGAIGCYRGLKHLFAAPRPELSPLDTAGLHPVVEGLLELTATASSYGFPSGHATSATVVYLGLASILTIGTRRKRFAVAVGVVALVATTRVVLAVHYLADVVAGVALGSAFVAAVLVLPRKLAPAYRVQIAYAVAFPFIIFYLLTSRATGESVLLLGGTVAVFVGWHLLRSVSPWEIQPTG